MARPAHSVGASNKLDGPKVNQRVCSRRDCLSKTWPYAGTSEYPAVRGIDVVDAFEFSRLRSQMLARENPPGADYQQERSAAAFQI